MAGPPPLRVHQAQALDALERVWAAGRRRAWVVLPPGAGKTRVGVETLAAALRAGTASHAVVLAPNTAIQGQWLRAVAEHGLTASPDRELGAQVSCLTYQSAAVFDPDAEVDDDPAGPEEPAPTLIDRLHANGRALVDRLRAEPRLLLVLDECHHLLEVWGRLLGDVLHELEEARVLGLTATPPDALSADQAELVATLFGDVAFRAGVPAVVKVGDLAPFAELAWLTTPTAHEESWLAEEAERFAELTTYLTDPAFGSVPFLAWLTDRFVDRVPHPLSWSEVAKAEPELSDAALRMSHHGLLALPYGARLLERHRRRPDAADWVGLLDAWVTERVAPSEDPRDQQVLEAIRRALPSVGYVLTRRGIRRGRTPVDRVLARSTSKTTATVEIVAHEVAQLGPGARVLVLCDHEQASATLPTGLQGVIDAQAGSARAALAALVADPATRDLSPLLVTGSTVAGAPGTLLALADHAAAADPRLAGRLTVEGDGPVALLVGPWSSRTWVPPVTSFFQAGHSQVLVGTRGLLGEGWDARRITSLVDLTTATTLTSVVQTRGRALRTDPEWPGKVAVNWSVVCVSEAHPQGRNDWSRLVRKHEGFHGVDDDGDVVDGVGHLDPSFSPYAPPPVAEIDEVNARMRARAADRDAIRARWRLGEPYADRVVATLRVSARGAPPAAVSAVTRVPVEPPRVVLGPTGAEVRDRSLTPPGELGLPDAGAALLVVAGLVLAVAAPVLGLLGVAAGLALGGWVLRRRGTLLSRWLRGTVEAAAVTPSVGRVAAAVADGLHRGGLTSAGAAAVVVELHPDGDVRCRLESSTQDAAVFAEALDEALAPVAHPRYLLSRAVLGGPPELARRPRTQGGAMAALRRVAAPLEAWHQVPSVLGANADRAAAYAAAWASWVGPGRLLYTGSPDGAGVLAAQHGADPFDVTTVMRRHWV